MYSVKNPMKNIDLLDNYFRYEILEYVPEKRQVILCYTTNTIWFGNVDIFLNKLKLHYSRTYLIDLKRLIEAVELKYKRDNKVKKEKHGKEIYG